MLKRLVEPRAAAEEVTIGAAAYPAPFAPGLEFNAPVHGAWNIVHTGMLLPESIQIYVCAANCMRGVVLTAAEMNAADRFSHVILRERDLLDGTAEQTTIEGVSDVLQKRGRLPRAVLLFTVCLHHFLGCDLNHIYRELERRFPTVAFLRCYMDPILQKTGLTPEQKLRKALYDPLQPRPAQPNVTALLGSDFVLDADGDIPQMLARNGAALRQLPDCRTFDDYLSMGEAGLLLAVCPAAKYGAEMLSQRLDRPLLYLPASFSYAELTEQRRALCAALHIPFVSPDVEIADCEAALDAAGREIGQTPVHIDYTAHPRPLGLARLLLAHGFRVERVFLERVSPEEAEDFRALQRTAPSLCLTSTVRPEARVRARGSTEKTLAIGQKAAWFADTPHFVNLVGGGGLHGFSGVKRMAALLLDAYRTEQDTRDIVPRKGWGCESCI